MMKSQFSSAFLLAILVLGVAVVNAVNLGAAQTSTSVKGILSSDTTWTKSGSPYVLTGPLCVAKGVTLRIEPGVTVDLDSYYILVNGTLYARGSSEDKIVFNSNVVLYDNERITFADVSNSWNEQAGTGCIIENAILNSISITMGNVSPKISGNSFNDASWSNLITIEGGSPIISNNTMIFNGNGIHSIGGAPAISDNFIQGIFSSTGIFTNGFDSGALTTIVRNTIINNKNGINGYGGYQIIEGNIIQNNEIGIIEGGTIRNNTIANSSIAIDNPSTQSIITYNNIVDYSQYSIRLSQWDNFDVNATYNWWGTTDTGSIDQSIHDFEDDFNLGKVNYIPFLTEPNPAIASQIHGSGQPITPTPTPNPTPEPSPSTRKTTLLTLACSISASYPNFEVDISGRLTADGAGISNVPVLLAYSANGGASWTELMTINTDNGGVLTATYQPSTPGNYLLRASWAGNSDYSATSATISFAAEQNIFSIATNSTISELFFDSENRELRFSVSGPDGTSGYVNVHVAKSFLSDVANLKVNLDGEEIAFSTESQEDSWLLVFTYRHSIHNVVINLGSTGFDESLLGPILVIGLPLAATVLFFAVNKIKYKKPKTTSE